MIIRLIALAQGGYSIEFSLAELFFSVLGMVIFAFLGSYGGVLAGNIKREKDIEAMKARQNELASALSKEEGKREEADRDLRQSIADVDEGLTQSVKEANQRIDRWIENPMRFRGPRQ